MSTRVRALVLALIGAAALAAAFGAGALAAVAGRWGSPLVVVDVSNAAGVRARSLVLEIDSCGATSRIVGPALAPGGRARLGFVPCGEAGYRLRATLEDGREFVGRGGYAEPGYSVAEVVRDPDASPGDRELR